MSENRNDAEKEPHWKEDCSNKRQKKRRVSGELDSAASRKQKSPVQPKGGSARSHRPTLETLCECFSEVTDPRVNRRRRHLLIDILMIAILAVIANANTWKDIRIWGQAQQQWLTSFLSLPNGIPSCDTFRRTISRINPQEFQAAFLRWLRGLRTEIPGVIAIDGKTLRGSRTAEDGPLQIVSAWATKQHLTLGQRRVDGDSNEITAIPELLKVLELKGAIVTLDAMGCQKEIATAIRKRKGNYSLAVKRNHEHLYEDIAASFEAAFENEFGGAREQQHQTEEANQPHGRSESRYYYTLPVPKTLRSKAEWTDLKSIGMTISYRGQGKAPAEEAEIRYYIMSFASNVKRFADAIRSHWGIENSLHWVLDVTFREDESRIRKEHGAENVSWLRRLAVTLIKNETEEKDSIRAKRIRAGYDLDYLKQILNAIPS